MRLLALWVVPSLCLGFSVTSDAHHSRAQYSKEVTEMNGVLEDVEWRNPHVYFVFRSQDADGDSQLWTMEAGSPYMLNRAGVTQDLFRLGEPVKVAGNVSEASADQFLVTNMLFGEEDEILVLPTALPRWSDERVGGRDQWISDTDRLEEAGTAAGSGIFQVWSVSREGGRRQDLPFTDEALAARARWNPVDNPIIRCQQPGMPRIMFNPHPFEFVDEGDRIMLYGEEFDMVRTIHLDSAQDPSKQPMSNLGYSVGHWEGSTLVVRTSRIDWPYFDGLGTPQSDAVEIVERFTLSSDEQRLDYHVTVTDPLTFSRPAVIEDYWLALGESRHPYNCAVN